MGITIEVRNLVVSGERRAICTENERKVNELEASRVITEDDQR